MKLCPSKPPVIIYNNSLSTICVNQKQFINPNSRFNFIDKDGEIFISLSYKDSELVIKRKSGRKVTLKNLEVTSVQRGNREYIYVGKNLKLPSPKETFYVYFHNIIISAFDDDTEFINLYLRDLELKRTEDNIVNTANCDDEPRIIFSASLKGFQIDNQYSKAFFPIILNPVNPLLYYYNKKSSEDQFFLAFKCEIPSQFFRYGRL